MRNIDQNFKRLPVNIPNTFICDIDAFLLNARSLRKHHEELEVLVHNLESPSAILSLTELWLDSSDLYKKGGIMIQFVKETDLIEEHPCSKDKSVLVEVRISGNRLLLLISYNPLRSNKLHFLTQLDHQFEKLSRRKKSL